MTGMIASKTKVSSVSATPPATFPASYDSTTKIISAIMCVLVVVVSVVARSMVATAIGVVVVALSYAYSPRGYIVADRSIIVKRLIGNRVIALEGLGEARAATPEDLRGRIRIWGSGGMFGYYGLFRTSRLGTCRWHMTNRQNAVIVFPGQGTTLFSPDDVHGFLAAVRAVG